MLKATEVKVKILIVIALRTVVDRPRSSQCRLHILRRRADARTMHRLSAGGAHADHTCALLNDNSLKCWGQGSYGRLGYGLTVGTIGDSAGEMESLGRALRGLEHATADGSCRIASILHYM